MSDRKTILITGASSGIGFDAARELSASGHSVFGTCRNPEADGYGFTMLKMDVRDDDSVVSAINEIMDRCGRIDVLINNAGVGLRGAVEEASIEESQQVFETNLFGVLRVSRSVVPIMRKQQAGLIINISSIAGLVALPFNGIYSASKFAIEGLSQAMRMELEQFGIKVAVINPGFINTKFAHNAQYSKAKPAYESLRKAGQERIETGLGSAPLPDIVTEAIVEIVEEDVAEYNYIIGEDSDELLDKWNAHPPDEFVKIMRKAYNI